VNYGVGALVSVSNQEGVFEKVASGRDCKGVRPGQVGHAL
jgi:hypothetical protein